MDDYIKREDAKKKHCEICKDNNVCYRSYDNCKEVKAFDLIQAADVVEHITAKEVQDENNYRRCNNCGCSLSATVYVTEDRQLILHPNFCPNCGADMRK